MPLNDNHTFFLLSANVEGFVQPRVHKALYDNVWSEDALNNGVQLVIVVSHCGGPIWYDLKKQLFNYGFYAVAKFEGTTKGAEGEIVGYAYEHQVTKHLDFHKVIIGVPSLIADGEYIKMPHEEKK